MAAVRTNDHIAYSPHLPLMSAVLAMKLPTKKASVSIILNMNKIFIFCLILKFFLILYILARIR